VIWGGLNNALTAWRTAVVRRFPGKDNTSDGARADAAHSATSQHQADADGTVDAYDMDVNVLRGTPASGTAVELRIIEAMKLDFERDPRSRGQLWIHDRKIANRDRFSWLERDYTGPNPHDKHVHWESRQSHEDDGSVWPMPHTDALLRELEGDDVDKADVKTALVEVLTEPHSYDLKRIGERGWSNISDRVKMDYIFEALVAAGLIDADGDGQVDDSASIPARLARIEGALARLEQAVPPGAPGS
jgi:hypothetical protein